MKHNTNIIEIVCLCVNMRLIQWKELLFVVTHVHFRNEYTNSKVNICCSHTHKKSDQQTKRPFRNAWASNLTWETVRNHRIQAQKWKTELENKTFHIMININVNLIIYTIWLVEMAPHCICIVSMCGAGLAAKIYLQSTWPFCYVVFCVNLNLLFLMIICNCN